MGTQKGTANPTAGFSFLNRSPVPPLDMNIATVQLSVKYKFPNQVARDMNFHWALETPRGCKSEEGLFRRCPNTTKF